MGEHRCCFPGGMVIKPNGVNELAPCSYVLTGKCKNVTVEILRCTKCGHVSIGWYRQENTEEISFENE